MIDKIENFLNFFNSNKNVALAIMIISIIGFVTALTAQHIFRIKPCQLCLYQRVPYALNAVFGLMAFLATFRYPKVTRLLIAVSIITFAGGAVVAGFQTGLEYGWWTIDIACELDEGFIKASMDQLKAILGKVEHKDCSDPAFTLFGISLAGFNFVGSLFISAVLSYFSFFRCRNDRDCPLFVFHKQP